MISSESVQSARRTVDDGGPFEVRWTDRVTGGLRSVEARAVEITVMFDVIEEARTEIALAGPPPSAMKDPEQNRAGPESVLEEAARIISGQRREDYGEVGESFDRIGKYFEAVLGHPVSGEEVALCMIGLKMARFQGGGGQRDSVVDMAGYAGCLAQISEVD